MGRAEAIKSEPALQSAVPLFTLSRSLNVCLRLPLLPVVSARVPFISTLPIGMPIEQAMAARMGKPMSGWPKVL